MRTSTRCVPVQMEAAIFAWTILLCVVFCSGWQAVPTSKRLYAPVQLVSWEIQWGQCSRSCGYGELKPHAVCVSELTKNVLGDAACHDTPKPPLPEKKSCQGVNCPVNHVNHAPEEHLAKRQNNTTTHVFSPPAICDRTVPGETGELTSPNWPTKSILFLQCRVTIVLPQGMRPRITFDTFILEGSGECAGNNSVEIFDVLTNRSEQICGTCEAFSWTADSNKVQIKFSAESSTVFHRFHASYFAIPKAPDSECSAVFDGQMGRYVSAVGPAASETSPTLCEVLFHAPPGSRVVLSFPLFTVPCMNPVLIQIIKIGQQKTLCGTHQPFSWTSTGNEAILIYERPTAEDDWEMELEYEPIEEKQAGEVDCNQIIRDSQNGAITSPNYPGSYPDNAHCQTFILADPGQVITIAFQNFMVEPSTKQNGEPTETCQFDHVMILDVTTDRTDIICGMRQPFAWTSDSNEVLVVFVSDNSEAYTGFEAQYVLSDKHPEADCLTVKENTTAAGEISTVGYPSPYPGNSKCFLTIHEKPDTFVIFDVTTFDLEESDMCEKDALQVTDLTTKRSERICGKKPPFTWTSDSNEVQLSFTSDDRIQMTGFIMDVLATELPLKSFPQRDCRQLLTKNRDYVRLPLSLGKPPLGDASCFILISVQPERRIVLNIGTFLIEPPPTGYDPDFVEIRDVSLSENSHKERFEGELPSFTWTSRQNEIMILATQVSSDIASVRLHGTYFALERPKQACSRLLLNQAGTIRWPADFLEDSTDCELTIHTHPLKRVVLVFDKVDLHGSSCGEFSIEVVDVEPGRKLSYCTDQEPFAIISTSNEIRLIFKWAIIGELKAARKRHMSLDAIIINYLLKERPLKAVEHVAEYHRVFRKEQGEFSSLDHSRAEWMSGNCSVMIEVPSDKQVLIHFQDFLIGEQRPNLEGPPPRCNPEFVLVEDCTNGRSSIFCGNYAHFSWLSDTNAVVVTFFTNPVIVYHGFRAKYETVPRGKGPSQHTSVETGEFTSTNFPENYPANHVQRWVIHSPPNHVISLVVNSFQLEDSERCSKDYVKFEDLSTGYTTILCGIHGLFAWTSAGNEVVVTISTDNEGSSSGISLVHSWFDIAKGCFQLHRGDSGSFKSADLLEEGKLWSGSCKVIIHTAPDQRLRLLLQGLIIEENCGNAGLMFVDNASLRRKIICKVSYGHDLVFTSDTNEVTLSYINYQTTLADFAVSWESIHRDVSPAECTSVFDQAPMTLSLDDQQSALALLPEGSVCHWLLTLEPSMSVILVFSKFSLASTDCETDYIEIEDLATPRNDRFCGDISSFSWKSDSNEVMIRFVRTENITSMSFVANFTSIVKPRTPDCSKVVTGETGDLMSLKYPSPYPTDIQCQTLIHVSTSRKIRIVFEEFELEGETGDRGCTSDYLKLTDLTTGRTIKLCGLLRPFFWSSTANEILLEFVSDGSNTFTGYSAHYISLLQTVEVTGCNETFRTETGVVHSPNYGTADATYANDLLCYQQIEAVPWQHVILSFGLLELEPDTNCKKDFVEIIDMVNGNTDIYCGNLEAFTWISEGNHVLVKFHTDSANGYQGYRATYKAVTTVRLSSCDTTLSGESGAIQSPNFPSQYDNNLHCVTTIVVKDMYLIQLLFVIFDLENSEDCSYDYLELRTKGIGAPQVICGRNPPFSWLSTNSVAIVTFHTDHIVSSAGFRADFQVIIKPSHPKPCDATMFTLNGTLTSPLYPEPYPSNEDCRTMITAQPGYVIQIFFSDFQLEYHEECKYDYVLVSNYPEGPKDKFCGTLHPFTWVSKTNQAVLEFHSDRSTRLAGYHGHYVTYPAPITLEPAGSQPPSKAKCNVGMTAERGVITSPNFPYEYDNDQNCRTEIETAEGTRINITFHFMDIEEHRGCQWDRVEILDLGSGRKSEPFCGSLFGGHWSWQSDSNHIVVIFVSDDIVTRIGFYATYGAVQTGQTLNSAGTMIAQQFP